MLNMDQWITPNHFSVSEFEEFSKLKPAEEFNLIAPITVYFRADLMYKPEARKALKELKKLGHPLVEGKTIAEMLEDQPDGLINRYNALMMYLVSEAEPDAEAYIDEMGAFGFRINGKSNVLAGDASGMFAFYLQSSLVTDRIGLCYE